MSNHKYTLKEFIVSSGYLLCHSSTTMKILHLLPNINHHKPQKDPITRNTLLRTQKTYPQLETL